MKSHLRILLSSCIAAALCGGVRTSRADPSSLVPQAGYDYGDIETARALAMGDAVRAFGNGTAALYGNPAGMALARVYHLSAHATIWPEPRRQTYGAAIVDSMTSRVAGGVGANYAILDPDGLNRKWTDARLAFAYPFSDKFSAGVTGRYLKLREAGTSVRSMPASYASAGLSGENTVDGFTFDVGLLFRPTESFAIGLVGSNLTNPGNGYLPLSIGGGIGYGTQDVTVEGDVVVDTTTYLGTSGETRSTMRGMVGFEYLAGDHFPLRISYRYDNGLGTHAVSGGAGYVDPTFSLELALRRTVNGPDYATPVTVFGIELQYFIESSTSVRAATEPVE